MLLQTSALAKSFSNKKSSYQNTSCKTCLHRLKPLALVESFSCKRKQYYRNIGSTTSLHELRTNKTA